MGFAVVANEVRSLAQRSAQAAKETAAQIEGAIGKTAQGIAQSNMAIGEMGKVTQGNATHAEEGATAARQLSAQAEIMKQSVAELLTLAGGKTR